MPLVQGGHLGSTWLESAFQQIVGVDPAKIEAPLTPGESHGTKILGSKFFSCRENKMLFYGFREVMVLKSNFYNKNMQFWPFFPTT